MYYLRLYIRLAAFPTRTFSNGPPQHSFSHIQVFYSKYVIVPADKAANNAIIVWRLYYVQVLRQELSNTITYTVTDLSELDIRRNHQSHLNTLNIDIRCKQDQLAIMYWIPKLHKHPCKARFIANSSSCTTTNLSILLTLLLLNPM